MSSALSEAADMGRPAPGSSCVPLHLHARHVSVRLRAGLRCACAPDFGALVRLVSVRLRAGHIQQRLRVYDHASCVYTIILLG